MKNEYVCNFCKRDISKLVGVYQRRTVKGFKEFCSRKCLNEALVRK